MEQESIMIATETSERMTGLLSNLDGKVLDWADKKEKLFKLFNKELNDYQEIVEMLSEEWLFTCSNQYAAGKIYANPSKLKKFLNQRRDSLTREEKKTVRHFLGNPWFYSLFSVEESLGKNFLKIYDYSMNRSLLLFSKGVQQMHRNGAKLFLCLLFDNGECHQTYGVINYFRGFTVRDIKFFSGYTGRHFEKDGDLSLSIFHNPVPYMLLYKYAELPAQVFRGEPFEYCSHAIDAKQFTTSEYSKKFDFQEKEEFIMCSLKGSEHDDFKKIFFDKKNGTLHVHTMGIKRYQSIIKVFKGKYDFPAEPSWRVSALMELALDEIFGIKSPIIEFEDIFNEGSDPALDEQINLLNALAKEMTENYNRGLEYSAEELAAKYDVPVETVLQLQKDFERNTQKFDIDIQGGFEDYTPPPPAERLKLFEPFQNNSMFTFHNSPGADGYFRVKRPGLKEDMEELGYGTLTLDELPAFIEDLFFEHWNTPNCAILFYTIYLLSKKGDAYLDVRDYAVEFLRLFWQTILPKNTPKQIEEFIRSFGFFCFDVLYRVGLIETDRELDELKSMDALYRMKASPFFYEWIRFIQSH